MSRWGKRKLDDIGEGYIGLTYAPTDVSDTGTIVLRSGNIQDGKLVFSDVIRVNKNICEKLRVRSGDILVCSRNGSSNLVGKSTLIGNLNEEMSFGAFMMIYRSAYNRFLIHYFHSPYFYRQLSNSATTTINQITKKMLGEIEVPFPPLETQKQITKTLDTAAELLAMRKQQLAELDNLIESTFYDMFGDPFENPKRWNRCQLSDLAVIIMGQSPNGSSYNEECNGMPLLNGPTEFGDRFPMEKQWTTEPTKTCKVNDILFCVRGATAGRMNISDKEYCIGRGLAAIRPKYSNMRSFIYLYLQMMYGYFQSTSNGSTFINISKDQLSNLPCLIVDLDIQVKFSTIIKCIEEQKALVKKAIDETQLLFDSLMSEYFE